MARRQPNDPTARHSGDSVTHQVDEGRAMGQRMIRMETGRVIETVAKSRASNA